MHHTTPASLRQTHTTVPRLLLAAGITLAASLSTQAAVVTFDELDPGPQGYWNGTPPAEEFATADTTFSSGGATFSNSVTNWGGGFSSWSGFVYSSHGDTSTPGFENQYSAYAGGGLGTSGNFAVGYGSSTPGEEGPALTLPSLTNMAGLGAFFTNTTYAALAMRDGYYNADKFGREDGTAPDYLMLTIHGYNGSTETGTVNFYLADFRFADSGQDYIVDDWTWVDLSDLGTVNKLTFSFQSSDIGDYGIDTPTYFAMDNLVIPEPSTALTSLAGLALLARRRRR